MTGKIGQVNHQEIEMVIPEWWTWWRWLVHSPTAWNASHESLKALTLVSNPIRKSTQTQVTCGWEKVLMHKHYNMSMHQYFLCFVTLFGCLIIDYMGWNLLVFFLHTFIHIFLILLLINLFLLMCQKSKNHIKSRQSKSLIDIVESCLKTCFALYLCANGFMHLRVWLVLLHSYHYGRTLEIYVTVVNRFSNLSWMISEWFCWSWDMNRLVPIYRPTLYFFVFAKKSSPNVNLQM